jgi:hypothetical protein
MTNPAYQCKRKRIGDISLLNKIFGNSSVYASNSNNKGGMMGILNLLGGSKVNANNNENHKSKSNLGNSNVSVNVNIK